MARLPNSFNAAQNEKMGSYTPIPADTYVAQIVDSAVKPTKKGDGSYLELVFDVIGGEYSGRKVFTRLNIDNKNAQTVEIANKELATIADCCGIEVVDDSEQLHGIPMYINVVIEDATAQYAAKNIISGYTAWDGKDSPTGSSGPNVSAPKPSAAPAGGGGNPPWKK